jgi:cystathionine gamma-synthase
MAGLGNVGPAVLARADAVCVSLTKFSASCGDVMAGSVVLNPASPAHSVLSRALAAQSRDDDKGAAASAASSLPCAGFRRPWAQALYPRDLSRLACEIVRTPSVVRAMNRNTCAVARWLSGEAREREGLPVRRVHWAYAEGCARNYAAIVASPPVEEGGGEEDAPGSMLTLELEGTWVGEGPSGDAVDDASHAQRERVLAAFYDACAVVKGPSFGTTFTLQCPFLYLAHYDLVSTEEGRAHLYSHGLNPYLVRVSVGCEGDVEEVKAALRKGLVAAREEIERQEGK